MNYFDGPPPVGARVLIRKVGGLVEATVTAVSDSERRIKLREGRYPHMEYWRNRWSFDLIEPWAYFGIVEVLP